MISIDQARSAEDITVHGDGEQTRDFVYVEDVARANLAAMETEQVGEAFNIGIGESVSIRQLAEMIQDLIDTDSDIVHTESRAGDIKHSEADIEKASELLGYEPAVPLEEGLERTVARYRNEYEG